MSSLDAHLKALLADLTAELPEVTERRMFGADALFANGIIFAITHDGRINLKFPDPKHFAQAQALEGAGHFDPMGIGKTMTAWIAMPEELHDDVDGLRPWVEVAHQLAMSTPPKGAKKAKAAPKKKAAPKRRRPA